MKKIFWLIAATTLVVVAVLNYHNLQTQETVAVTLFFADDQALFLVPERREVLADSSDLLSLPTAVLHALIQGPASDTASVTLPPATQVRGLALEGQTLIVDFSLEIAVNHWGGTAGERMTVYSIVNSLTHLEGIDRVQIMIDGARAETLAGHLEIAEPLTFDATIVKTPGKSIV
jgi:spore germination protein GerM